MSVAPGYRLRLFLSVDLVGSTAYKSGPGKEPDSNPESEYPNRPTWVGNIQKFFTDFPEIFRAQVSKVWEGADASAPSPQVWKTIGDEIVFCLRLRTSNDLVKTIAAFVHALQDYGLILERDGGCLDAKGAGWVAAFPVPNITIRRSGSSVDEASDLRDESFEEEADSAPAQFEFLGTEIDAGFRVARHAAPDRFVLSAQLALLLVSACGESQSPFHFHYHGRETMKGVLNGREYPLVSIYTERSPSRREVRDRERDLVNDGSVKPGPLKRFLLAFMDDEGIEKPVLLDPQSPAEGMPASYVQFLESEWHSSAVETEQRTTVEEESSHASQGTADPDSMKIIESYFSQVAEKFRDQ